MDQHSNVILPLQLSSLGGNVPSILIRVELNLSHWPLVCGWYRTGPYFLHTHQLTEVSHQLTLKIMTLVQQEFL